MPRVSLVTLEKLNAFFDTLPKEDRDECALCNDTLTHIVKQAKAKTKAGTATVTRELANRINDEAEQGEKITPRQLEGRFYRNGNDIPTRGDKPTRPSRNSETPIQAKRREEARELADEFVFETLTAGLEAGLDKNLHLGDVVIRGGSTAAGPGKILVVKVRIEKTRGK